MAQTGFTPIVLYHSATGAAAPLAADLAAGELAINTTDEKLYFKNAGGTAKVLANAAIAGITPGTGVGTALAVAVGSAGAVVVNGGALGTPSSGTLTNATGLPPAGVTGTAATLAGTETLTNKRVTPRILSAASYTTDTGTSLNSDTLDEFIVTAQAGALKFNNPTGTPTDGQMLHIAVTGTAARALTYDTQFEASAIALPTTTVTTARLDMKFVWRADTSKWHLILATVASGGAFDPASPGPIGNTTPSTGAFTTLSATGLLDLSGAAAGQIKFPATQNASADANTLDDYEEGTWTPNVGGTATYTDQTATYTKMGRSVSVTGRMTINSLGTGSVQQMEGLPFTSINNTQLSSGSVSYFSSLAVNVIGIGFYVAANATHIKFVSVTTAAVGVNNSIFLFGNSTRIDFSVTYFV